MTDPLAIIRGLPRIRLAHLPTPMEPMPGLASALGLSSLWVKRDDCTGLGVGGNKIRKLEFDLAAALAEGADCVVCGGVVQSNTARQAAAACAKLGLECHLGIMHGRLARTEPGYDDTGNALLNRLFGAIIHDIPWDEDRNRRLHEIVEELKAAGRRPYLVPYGASDALGATATLWPPKRSYAISQTLRGLSMQAAAQEHRPGCSPGCWPLGIPPASSVWTSTLSRNVSEPMSAELDTRSQRCLASSTVGRTSV
jgi:hypothetical protein